MHPIESFLLADRPGEHRHSGLESTLDVPEQPGGWLLIDCENAADRAIHPKIADACARTRRDRRVTAHEDLRGRSKFDAHIRLEQAKRLQAEGVWCGTGENFDRLSTFHLSSSDLGDTNSHVARL